MILNSITTWAFDMKSRLLPIVLTSFAALVGCGQSIPASQETLLVCEGTAFSFLTSTTQDRMNVTLTKVNGKVVKAVSDVGTFTAEKVDVRTKENKGPVFNQLIIEADKIVLQWDVTEDTGSPVRKIIIKNSGDYERVVPGYTANGQCQIREKAF